LTFYDTSETLTHVITNDIYQLRVALLLETQYHSIIDEYSSTVASIMPRPKNARVWNDDLEKALEARYQKCLREGKRDSHLWRTGLEQIRAVRKDIYQFQTGRIANMPTNLKKRVDRLCEDVIRGVTNVLPDGHVPTNGGDATFEGNDVTSDHTISATVNNNSNNNNNNNNAYDNPFHNDHYMKKIKIRGGAYAILMTFQYSQTDILRKAQICSEGQKFCDEQMDANFHAGRMHGAWSSMKTLKTRHLVNDQGNIRYTGNGFRDSPHSFSLTRDGKLFIQALFANRPEAEEIARQAVRGGGSPFRGAVATSTTASYTSSTASSPFPGIIVRGKTGNIDMDRSQLEQWIATARVGERKEFKVGKDRRKRLHDCCDDLQKARPGLLLTHGSSGQSRGRTLSIQLVSQPSSLSSTVASFEPLSTPITTAATASASAIAMNGRKRPLSPISSSSGGFPGIGRSTIGGTATSIQHGASRTTLTPGQNAALSAMKRMEESREDIEFRQAIAASKKMTTPNNNNSNGEFKQAITASRKITARKALFDNDARKVVSMQQEIGRGEENDDTIEIQKAIEASLLQEMKKPRAVKKHIFSIDVDTDSDEEDFSKSVLSPSPRKKRNRHHPLPPLQDAKKKAIYPAQAVLKNTPKEACIYVDSESESDSEKHYDKQQLLQQQQPISYTPTNNFSSHSSRRQMRKKSNNNNDTRSICKQTKILKTAGQSIDLCQSSDDENDVDGDGNEVIEIDESQTESMIDLASTHTQGLDYADTNLSSSRATTTTSNLKNNDTLIIMIDNRERNRNATPRMLQTELKRHLISGPLSTVWPTTLPPAQVQEVSLKWGDFQYSVQSGNSDPRRLGVSIERKRVNDLVQRSVNGDHLVQLFRMRQHCSLSILLIENDTRTANNVTAYNAQNREGYDPWDSTITCENDVFRMFGRVILSCDAIKFIQTKDEQASLRAIGCIGLMSVYAPQKYTNEFDNNCNGVQALADQLKQGGIPWRLAKRVANAVGGPEQLKTLITSCCNEKAKSGLLAHIISYCSDQDQEDLRSSATGWSDAIYRIITRPVTPSSESGLSGESALMLHKALIHDHGLYLSTLYQGRSHEDALEHILDNSTGLQPTATTKVAQRHVSICLTDDQANRYFPSTRDGDRTFYKLSTISTQKSQNCSTAITMYAVCDGLASKSLSIFEMEGSEVVELIRNTWNTKKGNDFVTLAKTVARLVDSSYICKLTKGNAKRIIVVCGLQPALDANAKKPGYAAEMRTLVDLVFAELLLCYDVTIIQALRKKIDDRVNVVKQVALACFHCGFLVEHVGDKYEFDRRTK